MRRGENLVPLNKKRQLEHGQLFRQVLERADDGDPEAKRRIFLMRREAKVRQKARPGMKATLQAATRQWRRRDVALFRIPRVRGQVGRKLWPLSPPWPKRPSGRVARRSADTRARRCGAVWLAFPPA